MIDKTPRYVYPQYFEQILDKTPGIPVEEDLMKHPDAVMTDVFHHVGLDWKTEYLQMEGLLKTFSNDTATAKWIKHR